MTDTRPDLHYRTVVPLRKALTVNLTVLTGPPEVPADDQPSLMKLAAVSAPFVGALRIDWIADVLVPAQGLFASISQASRPCSMTGPSLPPE